MSANVMVVFYSRRGQTEKLALAAGSGCDSGSRRTSGCGGLADLANAEAIAADAEWSENLARMKKEYIAPREIDAQWANVLVILAAPKIARRRWSGILNRRARFCRGRSPRCWEGSPMPRRRRD